MKYFYTSGCSRSGHPDVQSSKIRVLKAGRWGGFWTFLLAFRSFPACFLKRSTLC